MYIFYGELTLFPLRDSWKIFMHLTVMSGLYISLWYQITKHCLLLDLLWVFLVIWMWYCKLNGITCFYNWNESLCKFLTITEAVFTNLILKLLLTLIWLDYCILCVSVCVCTCVTWAIKNGPYIHLINRYVNPSKVTLHQWAYFGSNLSLLLFYLDFSLLYQYIPSV